MTTRPNESDDARLDVLLDLMPDPAPADAALKRRILDIPDQAAAAKAPGLRGWLKGIGDLLAAKALVPQLAGFAAAFMLGLMLGQMELPGDADEGTEMVDASELVFGAGAAQFLDAVEED